MHKLRIITPGGDRTVAWETTESAAVREAERIFEEARAGGATAFVAAPDTQPRRIDRFDPEAAQILMVPRVAGG